MLQTYCNADVLREIISWYRFEHWSYTRDGEQHTRTATLSSLARSSTILRDLALPVLWRRMESIMPLLQLLSTFRPTSASKEREIERARDVVYVKYVRASKQSK